MARMSDTSHKVPRGICPRALCILGMYESGTSPIARCLNMLGAYLGDEADFLPASPDNPDGYCERKDILDLHNRILARFNKTWDILTPLPGQWNLSPMVHSFKEDLIGLITKAFSKHRLWAWKDPKTCLLLPLWKDALRQLNTDLLCVFVFRNPLDVAKSLKKRIGFPYEKSFGLWFYHNVSALMEIEDVKTVLLPFDVFPENWESELRRCAKELALAWPENDTNLREKVTSFFRPDLRSRASTLADLHAFSAPAPVIRLYELLVGVTSSDKMKFTDLLNEANKLFGEYYEYARFFQDDIMEKDFAIQNLCRLGTEQANTVSEQAKTISEQAEIIRGMTNALSWKITTPLRWLGDVLIKAGILTKK